MQTFEELSDIFSDHNNYLTSRELLMRVSQLLLPSAGTVNPPMINRGLVTVYVLVITRVIDPTGRHLQVRQPGELRQGAPEEDPQETPASERDGEAVTRCLSGGSGGGTRVLGCSVKAVFVLAGSDARDHSILGDFPDRFDHVGHGSA